MDRLDSRDLLCAHVTVGTTAGKNIVTAVIVWNGGGCEGNLKIEAAVRDLPQPQNDKVTIAGECVTPLQQPCQEEIASETPLVPPPIPEDSICTRRENPGPTPNSVLQCFPSFSTPCPNVGRGVAVRFSFRYPEALSIGDEPYTSTYQSLVLSHGGVNGDPTSGISFGSPFWPGSCDRLESQLAVNQYPFDQSI